MTSAAPPILEPLTDAQWPHQCADLKSGYGGRLNIYRVMAHSPDLLNAWRPFRDHIILQSELSSQQRELVILRTAFRWMAAYEWAHHVQRGRDAGLTPAQILRAGKPLEIDGDEDADGLIFCAVDQLTQSGFIEEDRLKNLHDQLGVKATLDLMATVGMYTTLAFLAKSYRVPVEAAINVEPIWET